MISGTIKCLELAEMRLLDIHHVRCDLVGMWMWTSGTEQWPLWPLHLIDTGLVDEKRHIGRRSEQP